MGLIFHDGTNRVLQGYTNRRWNDPALLGNIGVFGAYNNEQAIKKIIRNSGANAKAEYSVTLGRKQQLITINFNAIMEHDGEPNAFVVKGVHQLGGGFIVVPHMTLAFEGYLYHLDMLNDAKRGLIITDITRGNQYEDAEGWSRV